jgi:hypothetical protein
MFSARNLLVAAMLAGGISLAVGCTKAPPYELSTLSKAPIIEDEAMTLRAWDKQSLLYANGSAVAQPTLFPYGIKTHIGYAYEETVVAPTLFYCQFAALPVTMALTPPWSNVSYAGVKVPPTYTAATELPPDSYWFK